MLAPQRPPIGRKPTAPDAPNFHCFHRCRRRIARARLSLYTALNVIELRFPTMTARIYKPSKTAMQSGSANTKAWVLDFEPELPRRVEPLMGWTSSGDMRQQLRLRFDSKEEAIAYCERHGIPFQVFEAQAPSRRGMSYADNFAFKRRDAWTH
jgi:ETC complex I subunit conserved region